jgi:hypothetical protein
VWGWDNIMLCAAVKRGREGEFGAPAYQHSQVALLSPEEGTGMLQQLNAKAVHILQISSIKKAPWP